jgi:uncharacterized lipoprotein YmbA
MPRISLSPKRHAQVDAELARMYVYLEALKGEYDDTSSTETYWLMSRAAIIIDRLRFELQTEQKLQHMAVALQRRESNASKNKPSSTPPKQSEAEG